MLGLFLALVFSGSPAVPCPTQEVVCVSNCQCRCQSVDTGLRDAFCDLSAKELRRLKAEQEACDSREGADCQMSKYPRLMIEVRRRDAGC